MRTASTLLVLGAMLGQRLPRCAFGGHPKGLALAQIAKQFHQEEFPVADALSIARRAVHAAEGNVVPGVVLVRRTRIGLESAGMKLPE